MTSFTIDFRTKILLSESKIRYVYNIFVADARKSVRVMFLAADVCFAGVAASGVTGPGEELDSSLSTEECVLRKYWRHSDKCCDTSSLEHVVGMYSS